MQNERLINCEEWKDNETYVPDMIYLFSLQISSGDKGAQPYSQGQNFSNNHNFLSISIRAKWEIDYFKCTNKQKITAKI